MVKLTVEKKSFYVSSVEGGSDLWGGKNRQDYKDYTLWNIPIFNRKYIFNPGSFSIAPC